MHAVDEQISYTRRQAAEVTGYSYDLICAAIRSGDLREVRPEVNGRRVRDGRIMRDELIRWLKEGS